MEINYRKRIADRILDRKLRGKGAVLLEGAKWCGKTTTAEQICRSVCYMSEPGKRDQNIQLARLNPSRLLEGESHVLLTNGKWLRLFGMPYVSRPTTRISSACSF